MSEASLEVEAPFAAVNPASSRAYEESGNSAVDNPDDASAAKAIADIAIFLGHGSNPPVTIHDVLEEIKSLRLALNEALPRTSKQDAQEGETSTAPTHDEDSSELPSSYRKELEGLKGNHYETERRSKRSKILSLLANIFVEYPRWTYYQGPIFRFKLHPESPDQPVQSRVISNHSDPQLIDQVSTWLKAQRHWERMPQVPTHWIPWTVGHLLPFNLKHAVGSVWWVTDGPTPGECFGVGRDRGRSRTMDINTLTFLAQCCIKGCNSDMVNEERDFQQFIMSFSNLSHPLAKRSLVNLSGGNDPNSIRLGLQYHFSYLAPVRSTNLPPLLETEGLVLERQFFRIQGVSYVPAKRGDEKMDHEQHFEERILSSSLMLNKHLGTFYIVVLGDKGAKVDTGRLKSRAFDRRQMKSSHPDQEALGTGAGLSHFLITLVWLLETWYQGWNETLDAINDIVGFDGNYTFDDEQLESYIFDSSGSMALSKQYFTVLQLLRTARQQIDVNFAEWKVFCDNAAGKEYHLEIFLFLGNLAPHGVAREKWFECWQAQIDKVTELLKAQTEQLKGRIDRKTEEVESLRDGLFNATSLREAMIGMALNRAIYVFTAVTVIYTPLGFMAALWALPILNKTPAGDDAPASRTALVASFVVVPILTYTGCGYLAWYFTSTISWESFSQHAKNILRGLQDWGFDARKWKNGIRFLFRRVKAGTTEAGREGA